MAVLSFSGVAILALPSYTVKLNASVIMDLIRSAKSSSDWTLNDLESYHISLNQVNPLEFFGVQVRLDLLSIDKTLATFIITGVATARG